MMNIFFRIIIAHFVVIRCQQDNVVVELKSSNVAEIIAKPAGFWRRLATRDDFSSKTVLNH
jgi:hypothetical protein